MKKPNQTNLNILIVQKTKQNRLYTWHTFWSCLIRCVNMKWIGQVSMKIQSGHDSVHRWTDRQTNGQTNGQDETSIPPFQFRWSGGYNKMNIKSDNALAPDVTLIQYRLSLKVFQISKIKMRRLGACLIFTMGITILVRRHLNIEMIPGYSACLVGEFQQLVLSGFTNCELLLNTIQTEKGLTHWPLLMLYGFVVHRQDYLR